MRKSAAVRLVRSEASSSRAANRIGPARPLLSLARSPIAPRIMAVARISIRQEEPPAPRQLVRSTIAHVAAKNHPALRCRIDDLALTNIHRIEASALVDRD